MPVNKVVIVEAAGKGKLSHSAYSLCSALSRYGCEVTLLTAKDYELDNLPRQYEVIKLFSEKGNLLSPWEHFSAARHIKRINPDIVHFKWFPSATAGLALLKIVRLTTPAKLVYTPGNILPHKNRFSRIKWWAGIYNEMDAIIAHSDYCKAVLSDLFEIESGRILVVPDYVCFETLANLFTRKEARAALGLSDSARVALFFGYINKGKGVEYLIDAFARVKSQVSNAKLLIAGQPVDGFTDPAGLVTKNGLQNDVSLDLRYVPFLEMLKYFAAADTVVLPYTKKSQSPIHNLAGAFGKPVICLKDSQSPEDSTLALARDITMALGGSEVGAVNGYKPVELSWKQVAFFTYKAYSMAAGAA
ncbi:MAG: glycosyltransferase [Nitrospinae bacterium]|nr:glycosyltransferase [Nitrospinota bacterium]